MKKAQNNVANSLRMQIENEFGIRNKPASITKNGKTKTRNEEQ